MSVDTRTPRTPTGDRSSGFDDAPALSMVKVPSDPAQIIVSHASFRVQLGASARRNQSPRIARHVSAIDDTARIAAVGATGRAGAAAGGRRRAVVWSGRSAPDDTGAHRLLQAVRAGSVGHREAPTADAGATQVIPRVDDRGYDGALAAQTLETPLVGAQRTPAAGEHRLLPHMRTVGSAYDEPAYDDAQFEDFGDSGHDAEPARRGRRQSDDPARHAYYPGRRMNLGVVLLPLRVLLGFIAIYGGMGKLCDPVYFDGGKRGSMVKWLNTLHPWEVAEPLRQFALHHPVGSGLVIAFLQVVVGVLTVLGCWQRVAAAVGAGLSAALIVTVSWKTTPVYDTPDIILLAAWSPLIIAGAPVYSVDGRLAAGAWRRLGPRADLWDLRRYVLRRGALVTAIAVGLTLLVGSLLGGAVRDADRVVVPGPGEPPRNELPGSPLPERSGSHKATRKPSAPASPPHGSASASPTAGTDSEPSKAHDPGATGGSGAGAPSQTQGTAGQAPPQRSTPQEHAPATSSGPSSGGSASSGGSTSGGGNGSGSDGGSSSSGQPGLVGGLLG
ncbi:DoxX family membrane protein [Streptomyces sp. NBC_00704]|uniref:DoxX family membrane protein n=1 Tax=Streptomyces sp. NBC_00704 TaxID=2975809 RepID=UPI002E372576|nr:DoxX family membrane protein [Streptomyces sp. NBC_00704]